MSNNNRDFNGKVYQTATFAGTGVICTDLTTRMCKTLRVVAEGVGGGNVITVKGKLVGQATYATTIGTVTGLATGQSLDVSLYDLLEISCTTFAASGTPKVICSGFNY